LPVRVNIVKKGEIFWVPFMNEKIYSLKDIKYSALFIQEQLVGTETEKVRAAYESFQALVDRFYSENRELVSERQYRACRDNYDFFMILLEATINGCITQDETSAG
jgi:hypothetical protein